MRYCIRNVGDDYTCSIELEWRVFLYSKIIVHTIIGDNECHKLYHFPVASIFPGKLHLFYCMVQPAAGGLVDLGKRAGGENATHIKIIILSYIEMSLTRT